ncbi:hypothetical protein HDU81_006872 [Chytriomyces hyalinus]|nr:hypothetical protein HDU81_006872 [Chytriomyces hyalinus]
MHKRIDFECEGLHAIDSLLSCSHLQTLVPLPATRGIAEMLLSTFQARVDRAYAILEELESQKRGESSADAVGSSEDMDVSDREETDEYASIKSAIRDVHLAAPWRRVLWLVNLIDTMGRSDGADIPNGAVRAGVGTDAAVDVDAHSTNAADEKESHWPNIAKKLYTEIVSTRNINRSVEPVSEEEEEHQPTPSLSDIVSFLATVPHATSIQSAIEELWRLLLTFKLGKLTVFVTPLEKEQFDDRILERPVDWYEKSIAQRNAALAAATGDDDLSVISLTTGSGTPSGSRASGTRSATARQTKAKNYVEIDDESEPTSSKKSNDAIHVTDDTYEESPFVVQTARRTRSAAAKKLSQVASKLLSGSSSAVSLVDDSEIVSVSGVKPASFYSSGDSSKKRSTSDKQEPVVTYIASTTSKQTRGKNVNEDDRLRSVEVLEENSTIAGFRADTTLIEGSKLPAFKKFNAQEQPSYQNQQQQQQSYQHHNTQPQNEYIYAPYRQQPFYKTHQMQEHNPYYHQQNHQKTYNHQQQQQLDLYQYNQPDVSHPLSNLPPPPPPPRVPIERESPRSVPAMNAIYDMQVQTNMYYHQEQLRSHPAPTNYDDLYQSAPPLPPPPMLQYPQEYSRNNTRSHYEEGASHGSSTPSSSHRNVLPSANSTTTSTPAPASFTKSVSSIARSVSDTFAHIGSAYRALVGHSPGTGTEVDISRDTEVEEAPRKRYSKPRETTPCSQLYETNLVVEEQTFGGATVRQVEGNQRSEKRSNAGAGGWGNERGVTQFCDDDNERDEELEMEKARRKRNRSSGYRHDEERDEAERAMCMECNRVEPMIGTNLCQDCQVGYLHVSSTGGHIVQDIAFRTNAALTDLLADDVVKEGTFRNVGASGIASRIMIPKKAPTPPLTYANVAASANSRTGSSLAVSKQAEVICID